MQKTQTEIIAKKLINNKSEVKIIIDNKAGTFVNLLSNKTNKQNSNIDIVKLRELFEILFSRVIKKELNKLIDQIAVKEEKFYEDYFKAVDTIFGRNITQTNEKDLVIIVKCLDMVIKKITENNSQLRDTYFEDLETQNNSAGINRIFDEFLQIIIDKYKLTIDEADDFKYLAKHYFKNYKNDVIIAINEYIFKNMTQALDQIEDEMDKYNLRNGKSREVIKIEKAATERALKKIIEALEKNISIHTESAHEKLSGCSSRVVDLIFTRLPEDYRAQRIYLEIIVDTYIKDRFDVQLDNEMKKMAIELGSMNQEIIGKELFKTPKDDTDELKEINEEIIEKEFSKPQKKESVEAKYEYKCELESIVKIYDEVLEEIRITYDIPENDISYKRLQLLIRGEGVNTQVVIQEAINLVIEKNNGDLAVLKEYLHKKSQEAQEMYSPKSVPKNN